MGSIAAAHGQPSRLPPAGPLAFTLLLAGPAAFVLWRSAVPRAVVAVAATSAYVALGYAYGPVLLSAGLSLVLAVLAGRRVEAWLVFGAGVVACWLGSQPGPHPLRVLPVLEFAVWGTVLLALAEVVRGRRESAAVWARARSQERLRRAGEERLQIARDLHDGVAHQISLISVRAGVALHLLEAGGPGAGEEAHAALAAIREASGEALAELRSALRLLRDEAEAAPRHPVPGLGGLPDLAAQWHGAGLQVAIDGNAGSLPAAVDQAAYRVVQEALTNVSQHSLAGRADIALRRDGEQLTLLVSDPGPARSGRGPVSPAPAADTDADTDTDTDADTDADEEQPGGRGLLGMRERLAALGGAVSAGPERDGWVVRAVLPVGPPS
jgi:signal transduction histidine kinase